MDTQQRPCRLCRSISRVKWRWCPPLMSKWLYRLSSLPLYLPLSLEWVKQRGQVVNHMSPPDIAHQGSVSDTLKLVSWSALCPALHPQKAPRPLCKAEGHCGRSKVLLLHVMEQLLIFFTQSTIKYIRLLYQRDLYPFCCQWFRDCKVTTEGAEYTNSEMAVWLYVVPKCKKESKNLLPSRRDTKMSNERQTKVIPIRYTPL